MTKKKIETWHNLTHARHDHHDQHHRHYWLLGIGSQPLGCNLLFCFSILINMYALQAAGGNHFTSKGFPHICTGGRGGWRWYLLHFLRGCLDDYIFCSKFQSFHSFLLGFFRNWCNRLRLCDSIVPTASMISHGGQVVKARDRLSHNSLEDNQEISQVQT